MAEETTHSERVLLVDLDPAHRAELGGQLGRAGHSVVSVAGGQEAVRLLIEFAPTAVITDMAARGEAAESFVETVRRVCPDRMVPILVMSGGDRVEEFQEMLQLGRVWYISHDAEWEHLERTFQTMLAKAEVGDRSL